MEGELKTGAWRGSWRVTRVDMKREREIGAWRGSWKGDFRAARGELEKLEGEPDGVEVISHVHLR